MSVPSLRGKVVLVTGATSGIGRAAARALALAGARVVMTARDPAKAEATCRELGGDAEWLGCDLERPAEVRALAATFLERYDRLDVLINNAGAMFTTRQLTPDGLERTFALNHLAPFVLTTSLLDRLRASEPSRVVCVSSDAHRAGVMRFDDLQLERWAGSGWPAYAQSKLANLLFVRELSRRLEGSGVTAAAVHPGFVNTRFARNNGWVARVAMRLGSFLARSPERGAQTVVWAATAPELEGVSGEYYADLRPVTPSRAARDDDAARRLWAVSERLAEAA